jgi:spore coat-associated protein N
MTHSRQLIRRPRRTIAALATGLAAAGVAVGSGADFSAQSANPANTFTAGTLTMDNSRTGAAIFAPSDLKPGAPAQTGTVDIANTGSLPGVFSLSRDGLASTDTGAANPTPFATKVNVTIVDCGAFAGDGGAPGCGDGDDSTVYNGTLSSESADHALGTFAAGEKRRYRFAAALAASAGNEYQGDSSSARYAWNSVQTQ